MSHRLTSADAAPPDSLVERQPPNPDDGRSHAEFLRRNGDALRAFLNLEYPPRSIAKNLLSQLISLSSYGCVLEHLDAPRRAALEPMLQLARAGSRKRTSWESALTRCREKRIGQRRVAACEAVVRRLTKQADFPRLGSMSRWPEKRWRLLFREAGLDEGLADTTLSLVLRREGFLPTGPPFATMYRRIGIPLLRSGRVRSGFWGPGITASIAWPLASLALSRCSESADLEAACPSCPARLFCIPKEQFLFFATILHQLLFSRRRPVAPFRVLVFL